MIYLYNIFDSHLNNSHPLIRRRNTVGEVLANLVNGNQLVPQRLDHFGGLKRVSYNEEQYRLDYPECPIWVTDFSEAQDEYLIYLPCNRNHIFHENWIIPWLRQHPNCPLCKANVNNDAINRYAQ